MQRGMPVRKLLVILLALCSALFGQNAKPKFVVSISGELDVNTSDALADIINRAVIKSNQYSVLPNDRQFRETLKKEWKKGNINDDRIIALAKNSGADYLCFAKITSLLGSNQVAVQLVNLKSEPMEYSNMGIARGKLNDLDYFAKKIEEAVDDMLGIGKQEPKTVKEEPKTNKQEPEQKSSRAINYGDALTDARDGKAYKTVKIGTQTWMAENLNYNASGSKCYDNKAQNCDKYGRLYDWNAAMKACPSGWHLPSKAEWDALLAAVGGEKTAGKYLKAASGWNNYEGKSGNGEDKYGFAALPGGNNSLGYFNRVGDIGYWWSSSEHKQDNGDAYRLDMAYNYEKADWFYNEWSLLFSVRCLQGLEQSSAPTPVPPTPVTSSLKDPRDGKTYKTVKIGTQTWMAENLNYNASGSKCYDDQESKCQKYGRLYNWATAKTACPKGWHLPSGAEWNVLMKFVNPNCSNNRSCDNAGTKLKATSGWNINGQDTYGFAALPSGYGYSGGKFSTIGNNGYWWSANEYYALYAYTNTQTMYYDNEYSNGDNDNKNFLFSVRCLQDN